MDMSAADTWLTD